MHGSSSSSLNPTLSFACNLSHAIIREAQEDDDHGTHSDESSLESSRKRAKDKAWLDVFVVIQRGELNMFTFGDATSNPSGTFGGGNWLVGLFCYM